MAGVGLAEQIENGSFRIAEAYRYTRGVSGRLKERLRVGTVDAFQGKEFDVVLLSMTRSNDIDSGDERALRRKYGHLMLANRLCVAMSRQQRLLIVVGDSGMLQPNVAADAIPGLVKFRELCGGKYGIQLHT
jgi:superfamily I DNA and/or RNA helicase